jgi:ubiquinone/menaquinone biosynthesis C-methylase UbiE
LTAEQLDSGQIRETQRGNWTVAATGWRQRHDQMRESSLPITERLIAAAHIVPGIRVLDLASGVGEPSLTIAETVKPGGYVLGLDITAAMLEAARDFAREQGLDNVEYRVIATETDLGVEPGSFDAATCRWGLMFMPDPVAALRAIKDALRPGGRVAFSTWGPPERVPFMNFASDIVRRHVALPPPPPGPNQFSLPTTAKLIEILTQAGFKDPTAEPVELAMMSAPDPATLWDRATEVSGAVSDALAAMPADQRATVRDEAISEIERRFGSGAVSIGGEALVASGMKPS